MAREHARVKLSIWADDDFRKLSPPAQHLYFVLMTSPKLDYCGITDWRPARIAQLAGGWSVRAVEVAAQELSEQMYLIIDTEAEEVLLRSFVRNDGLMEQPNLAVAMRKAHMSAASSMLRGVVIHELQRLRDDKPELKGWGKVSGWVSDQTSVDPSTCPTFTPSVDPSIDPKPNPSVDPSVTGSPTTSPSPTPSPAPSPPTAKTEVQDSGDNRYGTLRPVDATTPPRTGPTSDARCTAHVGVADPGPCRGCRTAREKTEREATQAEERANRERAERIRNCPDCHGSGIREDETGKALGKCSHRRAS